jgi:hypothetical protein
MKKILTTLRTHWKQLSIALWVAAVTVSLLLPTRMKPTVDPTAPPEDALTFGGAATNVQGSGTAWLNQGIQTVAFGCLADQLTCQGSTITPTQPIYYSTPQPVTLAALKLSIVDAGQQVDLTTAIFYQNLNTWSAANGGFIQFRWYGIVNVLSDGGLAFTDYLDGGPTVMSQQNGPSINSITPNVAECYPDGGVGSHTLCITMSCNQGCYARTDETYDIAPPPPMVDAGGVIPALFVVAPNVGTAAGGWTVDAVCSNLGCGNATAVTINDASVSSLSCGVTNCPYNMPSCCTGKAPAYGLDAGSLAAQTTCVTNPLGTNCTGLNADGGVNKQQAYFFLPAPNNTPILYCWTPENVVGDAGSPVPVWADITGASPQVPSGTGSPYLIAGFNGTPYYSITSDGGVTTWSDAGGGGTDHTIIWVGELTAPTTTGYAGGIALGASGDFYLLDNTTGPEWLIGNAHSSVHGFATPNTTFTVAGGLQDGGTATLAVINATSSQSGIGGSLTGYALNQGVNAFITPYSYYQTEWFCVWNNAMGTTDFNNAMTTFSNASKP